MTKQITKYLALCLGLALLLIGCNSNTAPNDIVISQIDETTDDNTLALQLESSTTAISTQTPLPIQTLPSTETPIPTTTPSPTPTETPLPTATHTPSPTPIPQIIVFLTDDETGEALTNASVTLSSPSLGLTQTLMTDEIGQVIFMDTDLTVTDYVITSMFNGYKTTTTAITIESNKTEVSMALVSGVFAEVTTSSVNLRRGPSTVYAVQGVAQAGDILSVVGKNSDGSWVMVETEEMDAVWVSANVLTIVGSLEHVTTIVPPPTPIPPTPTITPIPQPQYVPTFVTRPFNPDEFLFYIFNVYGSLSTMQTNLDGAFTLDRGSCISIATAYMTITNAAITYEGVPAEWVELHNIYQQVVRETLINLRPLEKACVGEGSIDIVNQALVRQTVNQNRQRLGQALDNMN